MVVKTKFTLWMKNSSSSCDYFTGRSGGASTYTVMLATAYRTYKWSHKSCKFMIKQPRYMYYIRWNHHYTSIVVTLEQWPLRIKVIPRYITQTKRRSAVFRPLLLVPLLVHVHSPDQDFRGSHPVLAPGHNLYLYVPPHCVMGAPDGDPLTVISRPREVTTQMHVVFLLSHFYVKIVQLMTWTGKGLQRILRNILTILSYSQWSWRKPGSKFSCEKALKLIAVMLNICFNFKLSKNI